MHIQRIIYFSLAVMIFYICISLSLFSCSRTTKEICYFEDGKPEVVTDASGKITLSWPKAKGTEGYSVKVFAKDPSGSYSLVYDRKVDINEMTLENSFPEMMVMIYCSEELPSSDEKEMKTVLTVSDLVMDTGSPFTATVSVRDRSIELTSRKGNDINVYVGDTEDRKLLKAIDDNRIVFSEDGDFRIPEEGEEITYIFEEVREEEDYVFRRMSAPLEITRETFIKETPELTYSRKGEYLYHLSWNDTGEDRYVLQCRKDGTWGDVAEITGNTEYDLIFREPYATREYRILSADRTSEAITLVNDKCIIYSTVWPIKDLKIYDSYEGNNTIGTAPRGKAYCVTGLENGRFEIELGGNKGYIDPSYCMIDLNEVYGELMAYDIVNSYSSLFIFHEYRIPGITGKVIDGYEYIRSADGSFTVPLLYPVCERLEKAALSAREKGYRLKIYESFRPQKSTRYVHDTAEEFSKGMIPGSDITYIDFITDNGRYSIDRFLSRNTSRHNRGVALDLTLEKDGEEVKMQTVLHDLSWYSETKRNNDDAKLLAEIMKGEGFAGLSSEWWHFQDNEVYARLSPPPLYEGVDRECFMADDNGITYRLKDGTINAKEILVIDGMEYRFDRDGYLIK